MKIMFSAALGAKNKIQRVDYLERVLAASSGRMDFVAYNHTTPCEATFPIVTAETRRTEAAEGAEARLRDCLTRHVSGNVDRLMEHNIGEIQADPLTANDNLDRQAQLVEGFVACLDRERPDFVYLWNQFNAFHAIAAQILDERGIRKGFFHDGVLPGSIAFDIDGEMGLSWVSREPQLLTGIAVTDDDVERADAYLSGIGDVQRHPQVESVNLAQALQLRGLDKKPAILFAGQNDWHSGIKPESPMRVAHSPIFKGSIDALADLDRYAGERGYAIIFKPHPLSRDKFAFLDADRYPNTLVLASTSLNACIGRARVVVTIASQVAYGAVIMEKPVVMLGRHQISGKGLAYEAQTRATVFSVLDAAMKDARRIERRRELSRHAAQMERAYLFRFDPEGHSFFRRGPEGAAKFLEFGVENDIATTVAAAVSGRFH